MNNFTLFQPITVTSPKNRRNQYVLHFFQIKFPKLNYSHLMGNAFLDIFNDFALDYRISLYLIMMLIDELKMAVPDILFDN